MIRAGWAGRGPAEEFPYKSYNSEAAALAVLVAVGSVLVNLPVRFPSAVSTFANIKASHEWSLVEGPTGQLITRTRRSLSS